VGKTHAEFAVLLKMLIGYEFVMDSYELVMSACEISMIYLCIFETIYAVLLLRVGRVVVHLCDHNYSYGRIGGLRQKNGRLEDGWMGCIGERLLHFGPRLTWRLTFISCISNATKRQVI